MTLDPASARALFGISKSAHNALAQIAAGFGISVDATHSYVTTVVRYLADKAQGLLKVLRKTDPDHALLDGTLDECDRVGDGRADYSSKCKRNGVNVQVLTDPAGEILCCRRHCRAVPTT